MSKKLDFSDKLDFSKIDLTAPDKVVEELLAQLPKSTQDIISGKVVEYEGPVTSYTVTKKVALAEALGAMGTEKRVDIQDRLGAQGEEVKKFECFLYTAGYERYKYRMFFMKYGIANYPVRFTLEESIAQSIQETNYIVICNTREEVEDLIFKILTSQKVLGIMQELIRVYQAKNGEAAEVLDASAETE